MKNNAFIQSEIEEQASSFRNNNGYGDTDPILLLSLLLKNNIITLFKPLPENFAGMAIKTAELKRFMLINQKHTLGRQYFTIAHEIYHLFIQNDFTSQRCNTGLFDTQTELEEHKADIFSSNLLLPRNGITQLIPNEERQKNKISTETLFRIQQYYQVSVNAVIYRLHNLGYIESKSYYEKYKSGKIMTAKRLGYNDKIYKEGNADLIIGDYGILVNNLYKERKISESYYLELLNAINIDPFAPTENDYE